MRRRRLRYFDHYVEPITDLTQRVNKGQTGKSESLHGDLNDIVTNIARMSEELMEVRLGLRVFEHNEKVDMRFGLRDKHCRTLPWQEAMINERFAGLFDALPFGALCEEHLADNPFALPALIPLYDPKSWEPFGFAYVCAILRKSAHFCASRSRLAPHTTGTSRASATRATAASSRR